MAEILKNNSFIALPSSIKRGNPAPLDVTEIWFSYDEMANYATTNATAYVGQQMALVNENEKTAKAYIILNTDGDLQEIGSGVLTDNLSVAINDEGALHLHDYGVKYYKFINAVGEEGAEGYIAAHYEPQIVDVDHPWIEGLEPRVVLQGEDLVLGWYEPNPTTIDSIQNQVTIVQSAVETLKTDVDKVEENVAALEKNAEDLTAEIGNPAAGESPASGLYAELNTKANSVDVYTIAQANKAIADAVAGADHLKRKIMNSLEEVKAYAAANADATQYIFMVSNGLQADDNRYYEYMVFEIAGEGEAELTRVVERVGNWAVDLSDYATTKDLKNLSQIVANNKSSIEQALADEIARAEAAEKALDDRIDTIDFIDSDELTTALASYAKTEDVNNALNEKANISTTLAGYGITDAYTKAEADKAIADKVATVTGGESAAAVKLLLEAEVTRSTEKDNAHDASIKAITEKLNSIASGAQVNIIDSVEETEFSIDAVKKLSLLAIPAAKITGLAEHETIVTLSNSIVQNAQNIAKNTNSITSLSDSLNNYVLNTIYSNKMTEINADLAALKNAITWREV